MIWKCPECGAPCNKHGRGACIAAGGSCAGLICDCEEDTGKDHGTIKDPCPNAACYHCGWGGAIPTDLAKCPYCKGTGRVAKKRLSSRQQED